jgi:hypothetical protein
MAPNDAIAIMISTAGGSPSDLSAAAPNTVEKRRYAATGHPATSSR